MKQITTLAPLLLLFVFSCPAQQDEEAAVIAAVESFFEAFHAQDSTALRQAVHPDIRLQTIGRNKEGGRLLRTEEFDRFLRSITSIPDSVDFREKLLSFTVHIDGPMAHAWTPYEFWINDQFSHCGVNAFQLFDDGEGWKIIYLVDTRRRDNCR